jgi:pectate lyase
MPNPRSSARPSCPLLRSRLHPLLTALAVLGCDEPKAPSVPEPATTTTEPSRAEPSRAERSPVAGELAAFPGAEGWGAAATGGRGGRVIYVDTLAPRGPGSLQAALDQPGPRTIVFSVSGLIDADIHLTHGDVTIAGQSSPGGITIRQFHTTEEPYCDQDVRCIADARQADNWILRHVRIRPAGAYDDGLRLRYTRRAIVDHVSIAGATDEAVEISYANQITIQDTILAETLGDHASLGGMLINYSNPAQGFALTQLSLHHNVWHRLSGRFPELSRESAAAADTVMEIELSNNLLWDQGYFVDVNNTTISASDEGKPIYYQLNWVGNSSYARGPQERDPMPYGMIHIARVIGANTHHNTSTYFADNRMNLYPDRRDYDLMYCCNDYASEFQPGPAPAFARADRHPFPPIRYTPAEQLPARALERVGAFPRDPLDQRLFADIAKGVIDPRPRDRNPAGDGSQLPAGAPPPAPADGDRDGMPDAWERANGLDPAVQDHAGVELSRAKLGVDGYTNLEVYLHELADQRIGAGG